MPWKETRPVDERLRFITLVNESDDSFVEICRQIGISRKTGYKWVTRYEEQGLPGLLERVSVPRTTPHGTCDELVMAVLELRKDHPTWGPKKLRARLQALGKEAVPAASTIGELLRRHGLIRPRRRRAVPPMAPTRLGPVELPNDTWAVDFKGHFALGDKTRCHPLTITDEATRYLLKCEGLLTPDGAGAKPHFERAFCEFGLPTRIRSDNGAPFASAGIGGLSALSVWWIRLGIQPERIEPGHPQQNGRHERMHKTLKEDATQPPAASLGAQQRAFDRFRRVYNDERPHEALGQKPPASRYTPSRRSMPSKLTSPEYPDTMKTRRLDDKGRLRFAGQSISTTVSKLIANETVGMEPIDDERWRMFYGPVLLAEITIRGKELRFERVR